MYFNIIVIRVRVVLTPSHRRSIPPAYQGNRMETRPRFVLTPCLLYRHRSSPDVKSLRIWFKSVSAVPASGGTLSGKSFRIWFSSGSF